MFDPTQGPLAQADAAKPACVDDAIDAIRGIIILLVLVSSFATLYPGAAHPQAASAIPATGFLALQWFLSISGYRSVAELEDLPTPRAYLAARAAAILPALWPAILLSALLLRFPGVPNLPPVGWSALPANMALLPEMLGLPLVAPPFWRLKLEVLMAVGLGILWFGGSRRIPPMALLAALGVTAVFATGVEPAHLHALTASGALTLDGYLPPCAFGIALFHVRRAPRSLVWHAVALCSALLIPCLNSPAHAAWVMAALGLLAAAASGRARLLGRCRALLKLSELSFPIYVVHQVPGFALLHGLGSHGVPAWASVPTACVCVTALGAALHYAVERPIRTMAPNLLTWTVNRAHGLVPPSWQRVPDDFGRRLLPAPN